MTEVKKVDRLREAGGSAMQFSVFHRFLLLKPAKLWADCGSVDIRPLNVGRTCI